jgi:hypothetical protein
MDASSINLFVGLVVGFLFATLPRAIDRRRNLLSYWKVLRVEIESCHEGALGARDAGVLSPLGRLPTAIFEEVMKHIIAEADIETAEVRTLIRYYCLAREVNDSLDIIHAALAAKNIPGAVTEYGRTQLKTGLFDTGTKDNFYAPTIDVANRHCSKPWWKF